MPILLGLLSLGAWSVTSMGATRETPAKKRKSEGRPNLPIAQNVFTGHWVIMAENMTVQPSDFHSRDSRGKLSFVRSAKPTKLPYRRRCSPFATWLLPQRAGLWSVRVVPNSAPRLRIVRGGYWNTIEDDLHWHVEILSQIARITGFE